MEKPRTEGMLSPLMIEILALERKYQQELQSGAEFHILKSIRLEIRALKDRIDEQTGGEKLIFVTRF